METCTACTLELEPLYKMAYYKALRKHTYSNILKILQPKKENFQIKKSDICHIPAQNIDCEYLLELPQLGSSNEYPHYVI